MILAFIRSTRAEDHCVRGEPEALMVSGDLTAEGTHNLAIQFGKWFSGT